MNRIKRKWSQINDEIHEHKTSFCVYVLLRIFVVLTMVLQLFNKNYENVFLCILTLLLMIIPSFIQAEFKIELPSTLEIIILLFIFSAEILGEIQAFYIHFTFWDTILHTLNGFLCAAIGFSLVEIMNNDKRLSFQLSPLFMSVVAFCFSMTIGSLWELFEFTMDNLFQFDMQKDTIIHTINSVALDPSQSNTPITISNIKDVIINGKSLGLGGYLDIGLIDSMYDLIVNFIGAFTFSFFGYFYAKKPKKKHFIKRFIPIKK